MHDLPARFLLPERPVLGTPWQEQGAYEIRETEDSVITAEGLIAICEQAHNMLDSITEGFRRQPAHRCPIGQCQRKAPRVPDHPPGIAASRNVHSRRHAARAPARQLLQRLHPPVRQRRIHPFSTFPLPALQPTPPLLGTDPRPQLSAVARPVRPLPQAHPYPVSARRAPVRPDVRPFGMAFRPHARLSRLSRVHGNAHRRSASI